MLGHKILEYNIGTSMILIVTSGTISSPRVG